MTTTEIIKQKQDNQQRNTPPHSTATADYFCFHRADHTLSPFFKNCEKQQQQQQQQKTHAKPKWGRGTQTNQTPNSPLLPFLFTILKLSPPQIEFWLFFCNSKEQTNIFCFVCPIGYKNDLSQRNNDISSLSSNRPP